MHKFAFCVLVACLVGCGDDSSGSDGSVDGGGGRDAPGVDSAVDADRPDVPGAVCGDEVCQASETCSTCETDCGTCPEPPMTECNDGIDNDGDGLIDWQMDVGCWGEGDADEASGTRAEEDGWTTFDLADDSQIIFVSTEGDDANDGLTPDTAVATPRRGAELVRDGSADFLLFRRGDTWRAPLGDNRVERRFKSGRSPTERIVIGSYGDSPERPRLEVEGHFLDDDGNGRRNLAIVGLAFISFRMDPDAPEFSGEDSGAARFVSAESGDVLLEDNYVEYGEFVIQNGSGFEVRRNVVWRSYHVGTCAYNGDGTRNPNGSSEFRPSGMFAGGVDGLLIEENVWDENGWNPDVAEACATIYNHDLYLSGNSNLTVRGNLILRASSIGVKMASGGPGGSTNIVIEDNVFAEGEIGISMGGNADTDYRFVDAIVRNNVFTDIGRSQPTTRNLTWYITLSDNDGTEITGNLFVNQPPLGNTLGISMEGGTNRDVTIADNVFHSMGRRMLRVSNDGWQNVGIERNSFVQSTDDACAVAHEGGFGSFTYTDNEWASAADADEWFCVDGDRQNMSAWSTASGDAASMASTDVPDPGRNLDTYAESLSIGATLADFAASARLQSRHRWRLELTAASAAAYIRGGFIE